jgi:hypothetical protein
MVCPRKHTVLCVRYEQVPANQKVTNILMSTAGLCLRYNHDNQIIIRYLLIHNVHMEYPSVGISRPKLNRTLYHTPQMSGYCTLYNTVLAFGLIL